MTLAGEMEILRYTAFSADPRGGNPAGVVLDATGATETEMLGIAADLGYSETAFLTPRGAGRFDARYFSPMAEVPFCGHATVAASVAHAHRHGPGRLLLTTAAGQVDVATQVDADGVTTATLTSVPPRVEPLPAGDLHALLKALGWRADDLDPALPPRVAFAGVWHPVIAAGTRERLADLHYDMTALGELMSRHDWTTVDLVWRESASVFHARNPFPPGGIFEDPATGAAAAALGGYLRELRLTEPPATITVHQGQSLGRPSVLSVRIPAGSAAGIEVTGAGARLDDITTRAR
jgi:PhzF family phenazine biosynthesis protein